MATVQVRGGPADGAAIEVDGKPERIEVTLRAARFPVVDGYVWEPVAKEEGLYAALYNRDAKAGGYVWGDSLRRLF